MSFIGIISTKEVYKCLDSNLRNAINGLKIIRINKFNIKSFKNVKFDIIIIDKNDEKLDIDILLKKVKYLIINTDIYIKNDIIKNNSAQIITYGMNQKATITISSIKDYEILICLQRSIKNINNLIIDIQEFKQRINNNKNMDIYCILIVSTVNLLYSKKNVKIKQI